MVECVYTILILLNYLNSGIYDRILDILLMVLWLFLERILDMLLIVFWL